MNTIGKITLLTALALGLGTAASIPEAHASTRVSIAFGVAPGVRAGFVWTPGYWRHDYARAVWVPGRWVARGGRYAYGRYDRDDWRGRDRWHDRGDWRGHDRRRDDRHDDRMDRRVDRRMDRRDDRRDERRGDRRDDRRRGH